MTARAILFNGQMVQALLAGTKTQTRRRVKLTDSGRVKSVGSAKNWHLDDPDAVHACPYGPPGDLLWVRETFCDARLGAAGRVLFSSDGDTACRWKPSIHMPRELSRLSLRITEVRVQRLQEISEADAIAEGVERRGEFFGHETWRDYGDSAIAAMSPQESYRSLWESINGPGSWEANPWVWAITFETIHSNIDAVLSAGATT